MYTRTLTSTKKKGELLSVKRHWTIEMTRILNTAVQENVINIMLNFVL